MSAPATARSGASNTATRTSLPITYSTGVTARERPPPPPLPRLGNGYEPPGKLDCFADGTPAPRGTPAGAVDGDHQEEEEESQ